MKERVTYRLYTLLGGLNPTECSIEEEFQETTSTIARFVFEKVPKKPLYVILSQEADSFPRVLDARANISCASNKVLEYALEYTQKKIDQEASPLLIESVIENRTAYSQPRFDRVNKRLEKKI